jgi:hypothetical protein
MLTAKARSALLQFLITGVIKNCYAHVAFMRWLWEGLLPINIA